MTRYRIEGNVRKAIPCQPYEMTNSVSNPKDVNFDTRDYDWVRFEDVEPILFAVGRYVAEITRSNKAMEPINYSEVVRLLKHVVVDFREAMRK